MTNHSDVAIIGGGPAGQAAALTLDDLKLKTVVIDEQPRAGGQILRQPPRSFQIPAWMEDRTYAPLVKLLRRFEAQTSINWIGSHSVIGLRRRPDGLFTLTLCSPDGLRLVTAARVLIAAGCQDLAVPLPGWTLPGVYSAGGMQALLKAQRIVPGGHIVLAGTHPLQLLIAAQIVEAGGSVAAVLFSQPRGTMLKAGIRNGLRALDQLSAAFPAIRALATLRRHGVKVLYNAPIQAICGTDRVAAAQHPGGEIACDAVGLCYGFVSQSSLPRMMSAKMRKAGPAGGWATLCDEWMQSSIPGLYVAGETTGIAGANAAMASGKIAGFGIAAELGAISQDEAARRVSRHRANHRSLLRFARLLDEIADPRPFFPALRDDTLVCRCEEVALAQIDPVLDGRSANAVKLVTRCGMGLCQGRNCEPTLLRLLDNPNDPGFTARFPARPVAIGDLAT